MAFDTDISLRNKVIYSVYVRNHSEEGTFQAVVADLDRIKNLGVNIIWLMPIHPIGEKNRKGGLGCPYSIKDYRGINPEYGTNDDFKHLIDEIHKRDMQIMIDVVYNHTSHDSILLKEHPEWFFRKPDGTTGNQVGDWSDIIDLDYKNRDLWDYQTDTLKQWASMGVDGFRCDVAPMVTMDFWNFAREEVKKINPQCIWMAETVDFSFRKMLNDNNVACHSDSETFGAFDICYDYDSHMIFLDYLHGKKGLKYLLEYKKIQEYIYPANYVKLRFLENHDFPRGASLVHSEKSLKNWTAFSFFQKGAVLLYAGQENMDSNLPDLFDKELVNWDSSKDISDLIRKLADIKSESIFTSNRYEILDLKQDGVIAARYRSGDRYIYGIFNVELKIGEIDIPLKDGTYKDLIGEYNLEVKDGKIKLRTEPLIFYSVAD